jgi:hypothetical protein
MTDPESTPSNRRAFLLILLTALVAHGLLMAVGLVVSDDWFTLLAYKQASLASAWRGAAYLSMPLTILQVLPFFLIGDNLPGLRLISFLIIVATAMTFFRLLCRLRPSNRGDNLWVTLISVVFPGYLVHFMVSFLLYPLGLLLFLFALLLTLRAEDTVGHRRRLLFGVAAGLVFYSFNFGALLILYVFFVASHFSYRQRLEPRRFWDGVIDYFKCRYLFLLLPFWFWGMREGLVFFLPAWADYNQPGFQWPAIMAGISTFGDAYGQIARQLLATWWFWGTFFLVAAAGLVRRGAAPDARRQREHHLLWMLVGFAVLLAGVLAFVLVGKHPLLPPLDPRDKTAFDLATQQIFLIIDTRMHLFLGYAAGLILVPLLRWLQDGIGLPRAISTGVLCGVLVTSTVAEIGHYCHFEKQGIVMASLRQSLREDPSLRQVQIYGVVDRIGFVSTTWDSWTLYFETVWGDRSHFGVPERWYGEKLNAGIVYNRETIINRLLYGGAWYEYFQEPPFGCKQATMILSPGDGWYHYGPVDSCLMYYYLKYLGTSERLHRFLAKFVDVTVVPKIDLEKTLAREDPAASWHELGLFRGERNTVLYNSYWHGVPEVETVGSPDPSLPPDQEPEWSPSLKDGYIRCRSEKDDGGRFVVFKLTFGGRIAPQLAERFGLRGRTGGPLACFRKVSGREMLLFGYMERNETDVAIQECPPADAPMARRTLPEQTSIYQAPTAFMPGVAFIAKPYVPPEVYHPRRYISVLDLSGRLLPELLWQGGDHPERRPFQTTHGVVEYSPDGLGGYLTTDLIGVNPSRTTLCLVEWSKSGLTEGKGIMRFEDYRGRRILDVQQDNVSDRNVIIVPLPEGTTGLEIRLFSADGRPFILPQRIGLMQVDNIESSVVALGKLFPD